MHRYLDRLEVFGVFVVSAVRQIFTIASLAESHRRTLASERQWVFESRNCIHASDFQAMPTHCVYSKPSLT